MLTDKIKINTSSPGYKWVVLALLWVAYLLNQADRQAFNVVLPLIREDLHLTDLAVSSIATIFNLFYALLVPIGGLVGDRLSKKWIVTLAILFWSIATAFTGLANGMLLLIFTRSLATGGGEAFFGPANYSLLAQYHTNKTRAFAMSIHQTAYYIGIILSGYIAGYIGEALGWRSAFYVFGSIGIIHAIIMILFLRDKKEPKTEEVPQVAKEEKPGIWESFKVVFKTPTAMLLTLCFAGLIFVLTGYLTWMPAYLYENFNMDLAKAGFHSMFWTHIAAFCGILIVGKLSDKLASIKPYYRMTMQGCGLLAAVPFIYLMGNSTSLWMVYLGLAGFGFARAFFDGNTYTVLYDVIPAKYHSTASGVMIMIGFGIGALAPVVLAIIKGAWGLSVGITSLSIIWLICGLAMVIGGRLIYMKDYNKINNEK
jgi:MFS family permease